MFQTIISSGLTDLIKLVALAAGSFITVFIKHHVDLVKIKKAEAYVQSKPALEKLVQDVKDATKEVLTTPETIDKGAEIIAAAAQKQGFKVTKEQVAQIIASGEKDAAAEVKEVTQEVQQPVVSGNNMVQSPTAAQKA